MPTTSTHTELRYDQLVKALDHLTLVDLERLIKDAVSLRARRHATASHENEADLLQKINQPLNDLTQNRLNSLISKQHAEELSPDEDDELLYLCEQVELAEVQLTEWILELAQLRHIPTAQLMDDLGLNPDFEA